jgi:hypothetical protein
MKGAVQITITRANGRVEKIGYISGGRWYQRLLSQLRLFVANLRTRAGR